jgi:hypothetical protein
MFLFFVAVLSEEETITSYCLCTSTRHAQCLAIEECDNYAVPLENYYTSLTNDLAIAIASSPNVTSARIYLTSWQINEPDFYHRLLFQRGNKSYEFLPVDPKADSKVKLYFPDGDIAGIRLSVTNIPYVAVRYLPEASNCRPITLLNLSASLLDVQDSQVLTVEHLVTDVVSMSTNGGTILISEVLEVTGPSSQTYVQDYWFVAGLMLIGSATVIMRQISDLPMIWVKAQTIEFMDETRETLAVRVNGSSILQLEDDTDQDFVIQITGCSVGQSLQLQSLRFGLNRDLNVSIDEFGSQFTIDVVPGGDEHRLTVNLTNSTANLGFIDSIADDWELAFANYDSSTRGVALIGDRVNEFKNLTLNLDANLDNISFQNDNFTIGCQGEDIFLPYRGMLTLQTTSDNVIGVKVVGLPDILLNVTLQLMGPGAAIEFSGDTSSNLTNELAIQHGKNPVTLRTADPFVPLITIDDPVVGVLYESGVPGHATIDASTDFDEPGLRAGPTMDVIVAGECVFPQDAILAARTNFAGIVAWPPVILNFTYLAKSAVTYEFRDLTVYFSISQVNFTGLVLLNSSIHYAEPQNRTLTVRSEVLAGDAKSFDRRQPRIRNAYADFLNITDMEDLTETTLMVSNRHINMSKKSGYATPQIYVLNNGSTNFHILTAATYIRVVPDGTIIVPSVSLDLVLNERTTVFFTDVWFYVENPKDFYIRVPSDRSRMLTVKSDLIALPAITVVDENGNRPEFNEDPADPKLSAGLAFFVFVAILGIIAIISLVLCLIGNFKLKPEEEFDQSSDDEDEKKPKDE